MIGLGIDLCQVERIEKAMATHANFLIDKEGNIVGKDIYGKSLEQKLDELTR